MNLPSGVFERFRQPHLIRINEWAVIRIENDKDRYPHNVRYKIKDLSFQEAIAPYLHSDLEDFDRFFYLKDRTEKDKDADDQEISVIYSKAEHFGEPRLPDIIVVPNLLTCETRGMGSSLTVLGTTMGHYNPPSPKGYSIQEVYEFQSYGLLVLDHENGQVEMWVAKDGDKVSIPTESHVTLYNLGDKDHPLICLNLSDTERTPSNKELVSQWGPILLIYYDDSEVTFTLNRFYINNNQHSAGVRIKREMRNTSDRQIKLSLGARLDLGRLLYEQLTQNPDLIGQFARLGIWVKQASSEAFLEPLFYAGKSLRLYFSLPLVEISNKGTDVYRYFNHSTEPGRPEPPKRFLSGPEPEASREEEVREAETASIELNRPLVVLVEGVGDWVEQTYRSLFDRKVSVDEQRISVFYTDDTRWKSRPKWASQSGMNLRSWEVYLDKADPDDFAKYQKLRPDVVFIVTPDFTHSLIAQYWLSKVPTIFVEKPFDSQVKNIEDLRRNTMQPGKTEVLGLDHYQFYALPIEDMKAEIYTHLGGALEEVTFYLTEDRPIEEDRLMSLQYGLTLDLLPHLFALLTYFGKISTIDQIKVIEAGRYKPMYTWPRDNPKKGIDIKEKYRNETYSRIEFTFQDDSGNGFNVPCRAVVGKGFSQEVKYLEIIGLSGNSIRIDLKQKPVNTQFTDYPWDSLFFMQHQPSNLFLDTKITNVQDPYNPNRTLPILNDNAGRFCRPLFRRRYEKLIDDLLKGTTGAVRSTLTLPQGQSIVRALDRIWWAIQLVQDSWKDYQLKNQSPFALLPEKNVYALTTRDLQERIQMATLGKHILPTARPLTATSSERDMDESRDSRPVETRGPLLPPESRKSQTLKSFIAGVRKQANEMPLTIIIHKWQMLEASAFLSVLSNLLQKWDAIWLILSCQTEDASGLGNVKSLPANLIDKVITLDLAKDIDRQIYNNLVGDIVFIADAGQEDVELIKGFEQRCRFIIFDKPLSENEWLLKTASEIDTNVCRWLGKGKDAVQINPHLTIVQQISGPLESKNLPILDEIGSALKELAMQIEKDPEKVPTRRGEFRSNITRILDSFPSHVTWSEDLARLADKYGWPNWAVESLPSLYIQLAQSDDERSKALVWDYIEACIPKNHEYSIKDELCEGQLLEISMPATTRELVEDFAKLFNKYLRDNPYSSEGSFLVGINRAMLEIKTWLEQHNLATSEKYDLKLNDVRERMSLRR